jgi:hypothetical protein
MRGWSTFAVFMSGLFFGGGLDHLIFIAIKSPTSHYGLRLGTAGQLGFAALDFGLAAALYMLHVRWCQCADTGPIGNRPAPRGALK